MVIKRILDHLKQKADANEPSPLPERRAPPTSLFAWQNKTDDKTLCHEPGRVPACREVGKGG